MILVDLFYNLNITLVNQVLKKKIDDVDMKRLDTGGLYEVEGNISGVTSVSTTSDGNVT